MAKKMKRHSKPKYRVMRYGQYSKSSLGVYDTKAAANDFIKLARARWNSSPALKRLMKNDQLVVVPLSEEERNKY